MSGLVELQAFLADAAQRPTALAEHEDVAARASEVATGNDRLSPLEQIDIYRQQFWLRHVASLEEDFPTLVHLLGKEGFLSLCRAFLTAHPSRELDLRNLGQEMPAFLAREAPYASDPLLAECARTEWAFIDAFDAADAPPLDPTKITLMPEDAWPIARVVFQPALHRLELTHPAHELRAAVRSEHPDEASRPAPRPTRLVVFRGADDMVRYIELEPLPFAVLDALGRGQPLGEACEEVARASGQEELIEAELGGWFQAWASYGWIADLVVPNA